MLVVSPGLAVVTPPVILVVTPARPVRGSPLGQDGAEDEAFPYCQGSQGNTHSHRAHEDCLGQWLEKGQGDDGEEEDVLHSCLCCLLKLGSPGFSLIL